MMDPHDNRQAAPADRPFRCLAIEAAGSAGSIAVTDGRRVTTRDYPAGAEQSRRIYAAVRELLQASGLALTGLDAVAFGCGPGTFTGLRVTAAVTQALAFGAGLPVIRVSSLAALAEGAWQAHRHPFIAASLDARMGEAYFGLYACSADDGPAAIVADRLVAPHAFHLEIEEPFVAAGSGWSACPKLLDNHAAQIVAVDADRVPAAVDVLKLAEQQFRAGQTIRAEEALPNYIRDQVTD